MGNKNKKKTRYMIIRVINRIFTFVLLAVALTACSNHDVPAPDPVDGDEMPIHFMTSVAAPITRADALLHDQGYPNFGIWTWKSPDGIQWDNVMLHYRVSYDGKYVGDGRGEQGWGYDQETGTPYSQQILKYWDLSSKQYDFKGYAPFLPNTSGTDPYVSMEGDRKLTFHNIQGHFPAKDAVTVYPVMTDPEYAAKIARIDWVYCYGKRTLSPIPVSPAKFDRDMTIDVVADSYLGNATARTSTVPLRFHHLLPKVIFKLHVYDPRPGHENDVLTPLIGNMHVTAEAYTKNDASGYEKVTSGTKSPASEYVVDDSPYNWTAAPTIMTFGGDPSHPNYRDLSPYTTDGGGNIVKEGWMELPQAAPVIRLQFRADGKDYDHTLDPSLDPTLPQAWEPDHIYIYIFQYNTYAHTLDATSYMEEWSETTEDFELKDW